MTFFILLWRSLDTGEGGGGAFGYCPGVPWGGVASRAEGIITRCTFLSYECQQIAGHGARPGVHSGICMFLVCMFLQPLSNPEGFKGGLLHMLNGEGDNEAS